MLSLQKLTRWMAGLFETDTNLNLPEDIYDDAIPSGIHSYQHDDE